MVAEVIDPIKALKVKRGESSAEIIAHSEWSERKWVWIEDAKNGYLCGYVTEEDETNNKLKIQIIAMILLLRILIQQIAAIKTVELDY